MAHDKICHQGPFPRGQVEEVSDPGSLDKEHPQQASHYWIFYQNKKPIWKILRIDKNNNFKFTIKFLMTLDRSYIGYLGFLGIDLFKSVLMYSNGAICLIKLLFKIGLFTVHDKLSLFIFTPVIFSYLISFAPKIQ